MLHPKRPLVLVHGLWNTPNLFRNLIYSLEQNDLLIYVPFLPHQCGRTSLKLLAKQLNAYILERFGSSTTIDLLGFSMGGVIGRIWLQNFYGFRRTNRFISIGCPHQGTFTAQFVPRFCFAGIADMKIGSDLLRDLNHDLSALQEIKCDSFFCRSDLMVLPGWKAVLPIGSTHSLPVWTHKELISHPVAIRAIKEKILSDD